MRDLLARLEQAEGPSRELDTSLRNRFAPGHVDPPPYTSSLDAAVSLVPDGWEWEVGHDGFAYVCATSGPYPRPESDGRSATPALALCVAALRARMAQEADAPATGGSQS